MEIAIESRCRLHYPSAYYAIVSVKIYFANAFVILGLLQILMAHGYQ